MAGSTACQIRRTENFERTLKVLLRSHYRKDRGAERDFLSLLEKKLTALVAGSQLPHTRPEGWPASSFVEDWQLWKHYFPMPGLSGAAGEGRLIYLLHAKNNALVLLWIYTHKDFEKRPPDEALRAVIAPETAPTSN